MRRAVRNVDGSMISEADWKIIRQSATIIARTHLTSLTNTAQLESRQPRKKMFFKRFFLQQWIQALRELESMAPLLSLCAGEYKADMTLGSVLQDEVTQRERDAPVLSRASTPSSLGLSPQPRAPPSRSGPPRSGPSSRSGPPSRHSPASTPAATPPSSTGSSSVGRSRPPSPRRVALKSSHKGSKPPPPAASKGKRRREQSPVQAEKRARSTDAEGASFFSVCCMMLTTLELCQVGPFPPVPPSLTWSALVPGLPLTW